MILGRLLFVFFFLHLFTPAKAQDTLSFYRSYSIRAHYGWIIPHSEDLKPIADTNPVGFQVDYSRLHVGKKSWNNCNCFAKTGFSFKYFNYQDPDVLGSSYNLVYFAEPNLTYKNDLFYSLRAGVGATYLTQIYDEVSNPENVFFGSRISFLLLVSLNANYRLNEKYNLVLSANYNHISNGGMKQPNKGMNFPTISLGIDYSPDFQFLPNYKKQRDMIGERRYYARIFGTLPGVETEGKEVRKLLLGTSGGALYHFAQLHAINVGIELVYDGALKAEAADLNQDYGHVISGLMAGHNLIFGRWTFNQQMGFYLVKPEHYTDKRFYQRYELLYRIGEHYQIGTSLKAHGHVAENLDLRFGILF